MFCCLLLICLVKVVGMISDDCFQNAYFSTKTPYKIIQNLNVKVEKPHYSCEAVHLNLVHRHANRYPSAKDIKGMITAAAKINKAIETVSLDINLTLPWICPFYEKQDKMLSPVGEEEIYQIGRRLRLRFPTIFTHRYTPLEYRFISSCKLRCTHSTNALAAGLFENTGKLGKCGMQPIAIETLPCDNDPVLRFFEACSKYRDNVVKNYDAMKEFHLFGDGTEVQSVLKKVESKLKVLNSDLNPKDLWALIIACAYEIGMYNGNKLQGICTLFDEQDFQVMEYWYDLKHFYKRSAGHNITIESSCPLLEQIVQTLEDVVNNKTHSYRGVFRSAHAETIIPLYALLGIYTGKIKPTASNFIKMKDRQFRAACLSPFSGNLYFVLYNCGNNGYKIQMYLNERIVRIPCCNDEFNCSYDKFLKCYKKAADDCVFHRICDLKQKSLDSKDEL